MTPIPPTTHDLVVTFQDEVETMNTIIVEETLMTSDIEENVPARESTQGSTENIVAGITGVSPVGALSSIIKDHLENVDSDENFTEDEKSIILFEKTVDRDNCEMLGNRFHTTSEEDSEDDDNENKNDENFRDGYTLRGKPRKSYSSQSQIISARKRSTFPTFNQRKTVKTRQKSSTFLHTSLRNHR